MIVCRRIRVITQIVLVALGGALVACDGDSSTPGFADDGFDIRCSGDIEEGCPCEHGHVAACYPEAPLHDPSTGEEYCVQGARRCQADGVWGPCELRDDAERLPIVGDPELCGGCDPGCWRIHDCPVQTDLTAENSNFLRFDLVEGGLVLGGSIVNARYAFVANDPESTVSKIDLETGAEVGRYLVGLQANGTNNSPSRTALDSMGNAYVASRAFSRQGSLTKLAGERSYCLDRNSNGTIDTSTGGADVRPWNQDECMLWTVNVGDVNALPRAVAVDASDRVWVGLFNRNRFDVLDAGDGHLLSSVAVDLRPYGAAIGGDGRLWFPDNCCERATIQYVDTNTMTKSATFRPRNGLCNGSYGVAVDTEGRVLLGGYPQSCILRYTPSSNSWESFSVPSGTPRGVTIDGASRIWTAHHTSGSGPHWLTSWNSDGSGRATYSLTSDDGQRCGVPIGVGAGFDGDLWTPCQTTSRIARLDPDTGTVSIYSTGANPYTYSDFTGFLRASVTAPEGSYVRLYDSRIACSGDSTTYWDTFDFDAEAPAGSEIIFWGRSANLLSQLGLSPDIVIGRVPVDDDQPSLKDALIAAGLTNDLRYLEVRVNLRSIDGTTSPVFRNMDVTFYCRCTCDVDDTTCTPGCGCDVQCS